MRGSGPTHQVAHDGRVGVEPGPDGLHGDSRVVEDDPGCQVVLGAVPVEDEGEGGQRRGQLTRQAGPRPAQRDVHVPVEAHRGFTFKKAYFNIEGSKVLHLREIHTHTHTYIYVCVCVCVCVCVNVSVRETQRERQ